MAESIRRQLALVLMASLLALAAPSSVADTKEVIEAGASQALARLRAHSPAAGELVDKAARRAGVPGRGENGLRGGR